MNITIKSGLINLIKMGNYIQQIIKGTAKLSVTQCWINLAIAYYMYRFVLFTKYRFRY